LVLFLLAASTKSTKSKHREILKYGHRELTGQKSDTLQHKVFFLGPGLIDLATLISGNNVKSDVAVVAVSDSMTVRVGINGCKVEMVWLEGHWQRHCAA
jgi:hypothetical protein